MITNKELNEVSLSPTKKDYYQIWNELLELASKISTRWSPDSTNESDPGIILLKSLVAIADKLNYNIDKNTLEAFMPSATQQESMRKLTEMMGYTMKYYRAANCKVSISYKDDNEVSLSELNTIYFPKFINIKNEEEDVNYVTVEDFTLQESESVRQVNALEGELVEGETDTDNIISMTHLDDNNRYLLPETNVAENGIFICNIVDHAEGMSRESDYWKPVDNLNTQLPGSPVFKFGFDSNENLPYIQFPDDISQLIKDGLRIKYIRTNGLMGNVSARTLCKMEVPALWGTATDENIKNLTAENFNVVNNSAATNGADQETLTEAYNGFKKTIGTFDTLVTCRDYMNKIYQMTASDTDLTPLVSNAIVSDIRDDINRSITLCSFNDYGICYSDRSLPKTVTKEAEDISGNPVTIKATEDMIEHFDLILYPFNTIYGINSKDEYVNSFKINFENKNKIQYDLKNSKTISHNIVTPGGDDIACIKNYLKLKAKITTVKKVTAAEELELLTKVYSAIYENFNCHKIDFGEEIPYETILEVIENADPRIKDVNLDEPLLYTNIMKVDNTEYSLVSAGTNKVEDWASMYNKLVLRNVLAGRIAAFNYDTDFATNYAETPYTGFTSPEKIVKLVSHFDASGINSADGYKLQDNEVIQFRTPNLKTSVTYPSYVNYFLHLETRKSKPAIPATFQSIVNSSLLDSNDKWNAIINNNARHFVLTEITGTITKDSLLKKQTDYSKIFIKNADNSYKVVPIVNDYAVAENTKYYYLDIKTADNFLALFRNVEEAYGGLYEQLKSDVSRNIGKYVDNTLHKYQARNTAFSSFIKEYYIPILHESTVEPGQELTMPEGYTKDGLGRDPDGSDISKDAAYQLQENEYLLINYTNSKTDESGNETKSVINKCYKCGDIIQPNFGIVDSLLYHKNHSYSKTSGFDFTSLSNVNGYTNFKNPEGMFTLGTDEQICIKEIVKIELDKNDSFLYWNRNDENPDAENNEFTFDEVYTDKPEQTAESKPNAYTLKEGEYLYYTNAKKTNMAYYGAGSIIIKSEKTPKLIKNTAKGIVKAEDIMNNGLDAIPWIGFRLGEDKAKITVVENQYISLTEGDTFYGATEVSAQPDNVGGINLSNDWKNIGSAKYKFAEEDAAITLPEIKINGIYWSARSRLDFNMGPTVAQKLHKKDRIEVYTGTSKAPEYYGTLQYGENDDDKKSPIAVYANYISQYANHELKLADNLKPEFKLKVIKLADPEIMTNSETSENTHIVNIGNYENGNTRYTKVSFAELEASGGQELFKLNINVPAGEFGLVMFYYIENDDTVYNKAKAAYIVTKNSNGNKVNGIRQFNVDVSPANKYVLKRGIQVIRLDSNVSSISIYTDSYNSNSAEGVLIFSELSLVKGINPKLSYQFDSLHENDALATLLADIQKAGVADTFYYNAPIDNENAIDLNNNLANETLLTPESWYDPNNVNNKFVVSEISADDLLTGITLSKASRL